MGPVGGSQNSGQSGEATTSCLASVIPVLEGMGIVVPQAEEVTDACWSWRADRPLFEAAIAMISCTLMQAASRPRLPYLAVEGMPSLDGMST